MKKILLILLLLVCVMYPSLVGAEFTPPRSLNPIFLLFNPMEHNVSYNFMLGYLSFEGDDIVLYFGRDDWLYGNRENGVLVVPPRGENRQQWKEDVFLIHNPEMFSCFLELEGKVTLSDENQAKGCIAKYEATKCWDYAMWIVSQWIVPSYGPYEPQEIVEEYPRIPDGWDVSWRDGDGSFEDRALPVSMYRYVVRGREYYGKWITVTGRMIGALELIWMGSEFGYQLGGLVDCSGASYFQGSLVLGRDQNGYPVFNDQDYAYGTVITARGYVDTSYSGDSPEQFGLLKETRIQKVHKRGETEE